jgi:hypothetical protein
MAPKVGQRWQFKNNSYDYVVEIMQITPPFLVQVMSSSKGQHFKGEYFTPGWLKAEGTSDSGWSYLEGQDKP